MKKLLLFAFALLVCGSSYSQVIFSSNFETWTGSAPNGWNGSRTNIGAGNYLKDSLTQMQGNYALKLINCTTSHKRFSTQPLAVTQGQTYQIKFYVKGAGDIRTALYDKDMSNGDFGYTYAPYVTINSSSYSLVSQSITADTTFTTAEFIFSVKNTCATNPLTIDSVVIALPVASPSSIYDIQYSTAGNGASPKAGELVITGGIVTSVYEGFGASDSTGYFIQSGSGPWRGINVYDRANAVSIGDSVTLTALVAETFSNTDLTKVSNFVKVGTFAVPAADTITTAQANTEMYEGVLVHVQNAQAKRKTNFGEWVVTNGAAGDTIMVDDKAFYYVPVIGTFYHITGTVFYSYSRFRIEPRMASDIAVSTGLKDEQASVLSVYPNPAKAGSIIRIDGLAAGATVNLIDVTGKKIMSDNTVSNHLVLPSDLESGMYFLQVMNGTQTSVSRLLVK